MVGRGGGPYRGCVHRRRVALIVTAAVTGTAILAGAATIVWHYTRPRLPAVAAVEASADSGIVAVVDAAGDQAAVTVTELVATTTCQHTTFARGHIYTRTANLYTNAGAENALIGRIAAALPRNFHASRANPLGSPIAPLHATAGPGVQVTVQVISAGWTSATAQTDCRSTPAGTSVVGNADGTAKTVPPDVAELFTALDTDAASWHTETVPCPGGAIITTDAVSASTDSGQLSTRVATVIPTGARRYTTPSNRAIWRAGQISTVVAASDDGTHITAQITNSTC
jgi:hypothetical protein